MVISELLLNRNTHTCYFCAVFFCVKRIVEEISLNAKKHTNLSKIFHNYTDESDSVVIKIKLKKLRKRIFLYTR